MYNFNFYLGITNLRGTDIEYNPLFFSFGILFKDYEKQDIKLKLFSEKTKFKSRDLQIYLNSNNIELFSYENFFPKIEKIFEKEKNSLLLADKFSLNQRFFKKLVEFELKGNNFFTLNQNPVEFIKSKKNREEIKSLKNANIRDGLSLIRFFSWLQDILDKSQNHKSIKAPTEYECSQKLIEFRKKGEFYTKVEIQ